MNASKLCVVLFLAFSSFAHAECALNIMAQQIYWGDGISSSIDSWGVKSAKNILFIIEPIAVEANSNGEKKYLQAMLVSCSASQLKDFNAALSNKLSIRGVSLVALDNADLALVVANINSVGINNFDLAKFSRTEYAPINYVVRARPVLSSKRDGLALTPALRISSEVLQTSTRLLKFPEIVEYDADVWSVSDSDLAIEQASSVRDNSSKQFSVRLQLANSNEHAAMCVGSGDVHVITAQGWWGFDLENPVWHTLLSDDFCVGPKSKAWISGVFTPSPPANKIACLYLSLGKPYVNGSSFTIDQNDRDWGVAKCGRL